MTIIANAGIPAVEFAAPGSAFAKVFMDDKTNELVIREFLNKCYKSDEGMPAKTIFFCANIKHTKHIKKIFNRLDPKLSKDVQIIVSEIYRYTDEIARFKLDSEPRIALNLPFTFETHLSNFFVSNDPRDSITVFALYNLRY
jgi:hypothetical protein